jgi:hypothetical protein
MSGKLMNYTPKTRPNIGIENYLPFQIIKGPTGVGNSNKKKRTPNYSVNYNLLQQDNILNMTAPTNNDQHDFMSNTNI